MSHPFHFYSDKFSSLRCCFFVVFVNLLNVRSINIAKFLLEFNPCFGSHLQGATARKRRRTSLGNEQMTADGHQILKRHPVTFDWTGGFR